MLCQSTLYTGDSCPHEGLTESHLCNYHRCKHVASDGTLCPQRRLSHLWVCAEHQRRGRPLIVGAGGRTHTVRLAEKHLIVLRRWAEERGLKTGGGLGAILRDMLDVLDGVEHPTRGGEHVPPEAEHVNSALVKK